MEISGNSRRHPSAAPCYRSTKASMVARPIRPNITKAMNRKRTIPPLPTPENHAHTTQNRAGSAAIPQIKSNSPPSPQRLPLVVVPGRAPRDTKDSKLERTDRNGHLPIRRLFHLEVHLFVSRRIVYRHRQ